MEFWNKEKCDDVTLVIRNVESRLMAIKYHDSPLEKQHGINTCIRQLHNLDIRGTDLFMNHYVGCSPNDLIRVLSSIDVSSCESFWKGKTDAREIITKIKRFFG